MSNYLIEKGTNYSYLLDALKRPSFDSLRRLSVNFINQLPEKVRTDLWEALYNGVEVLESEALLSMYMYAYGKMHAAKLQAAFEHLPTDKLEDIHLIDWGCGQAMATVVYYEYLKEKAISSTVKTITLIEPSELALKRAALHAHKLFPNAEIKTVKKDFDKLTAEDIQIADNQTILHLFSNVLDIEYFKIEQLAELIEQNKAYNLLVCVSPYINDFKNQRLINFISCFQNSNTIADYINQEWQCGWTIDYKVVEVNNSISEVKCSLSIDVDYDAVLEDYYLEFMNVTDIDGNVYKTVKIGYYLWMAENLRVTRYRNGDKIASIEDDENWGENKTGVWYNYNRKTYSDCIYGKLYNWFAVDDKRGLAPEGWHIASSQEWHEMYKIAEVYKQSGEAGGILKAKGTKYWNEPNKGATNESGFCALPGGYMTITGLKNVGKIGKWWSTEKINDGLGNLCISSYYTSFDNDVLNNHPCIWYNLNSVRCVKTIDRKKIDKIIELHINEYIITDEGLVIESGLKFSEDTGVVLENDFCLEVLLKLEGNGSIRFVLSRNSKLKAGELLQIENARFLLLEYIGKGPIKESLIRIIE